MGESGHSLLTDRDTATQAPRRRYPLVATAAALVLAADQLAKWWAVTVLADGPVSLGPVRLALSYNRGAAFGLGAGFAPVVAVAALVLVVLLLAMGRAAVRTGPAVATGVVLGGALGNLADRLVRSPGLLRGEVVDFIDLGWWPVFNVADAAITVGCVLLVLVNRRQHGEP